MTLKTETELTTKSMKSKKGKIQILMKICKMTTGDGRWPNRNINGDKHKDCEF